MFLVQMSKVWESNGFNGVENISQKEGFAKGGKMLEIFWIVFWINLDFFVILNQIYWLLIYFNLSVLPFLGEIPVT